MGHHDLILLFVQLAILFGVALLCGEAARRLKQPAVLGELLGGIVIGPTVFGAVAPGLYADIFSANAIVTSGRQAVISLGLVFFLFVAGLEVNPTYLLGRGKRILSTSVFAVLVPFVLGAGGVLLLPAVWDPVGTRDTLLLALFVGTALSISALPVIARILMDLSLMKQELGIVVMAAATINDVVGWLLFALVVGAFAPGRAPAAAPLATIAIVLGVCALILVLGHWGGTRLVRWVSVSSAWPGSILGLIVVFVLVAAIVTEWAGIHAVLGAFLIGVALAGSSDEYEDTFAALQKFAVGFFAPLYFASLGLQADFVARFDLLLVGMVLLIASIGKVGGAGLGAWLGGMTARDALAVGFGLNARGAMEIVLASVALDYGIIDERIFVALIVMAVATSVLSGPMMQRLWGP